MRCNIWASRSHVYVFMQWWLGKISDCIHHMYHYCDMQYIVMLFFFFSSRRRHTRCSRDWSSDVCSSDLRSRFERYLEMLLEHHVEALIVVANWLFVDIQLLADLSKRNITAATIGWEVPGDSVSSVMVDNEAGGRLALEHLYHLGHRKIAVIRGPKMLIDSGPRWKGVQKFAHSVSLELDPSLDRKSVV